MMPNLRDSIFLISSIKTNNRRFGTGFVIYQDDDSTYILTCAHVIKDVDGSKTMPVKANEQLAEVIALDDEQFPDLAVLKVKDAFNKSRPRPLPLKIGGDAGTVFVTTGYFKWTGKQHQMKDLRGQLGKQVQLTLRGANRIHAWRLRVTDDYDTLQPGYSGSPVIEEASGDVLGIVTDRESKGEWGLAISIQALAKVWPDLPATLIKGSPLGVKSKSPSSIKNSNLFEAISFPPDRQKLRSRSPIIIALEEANQPLRDEELLRTERHLTITLGEDQISELEEIATQLSDSESIEDLYDLGVEAWSILEEAQSWLRNVLLSAQQSEHPQPIAWTGKADLLTRLYKSILLACIQYPEDVSDFISVAYGSHYFHPLYDSASANRMPRRQRRAGRSSVRITELKISADQESEEKFLPKMAKAASKEVVIISAQALNRHLLNFAELVGSQENSATRLVIGLGSSELTPDVLQNILLKLPNVTLGGPYLQQNQLIRQIRRSLPNKLASQAVPSALSAIRKAILNYAFENEHVELFKDALSWTTWSWVGRPLFATQFGEVIPAAYPHLMDLRSIASKDWYFDRSKDIPEQYKAERLVERVSEPEKKFHLYLTGAGGTGKSCFLRYVYEILEINRREVLPVWYKVDAPSSEWENVQKRIKEEVALALKNRVEDSQRYLPDLEKDLGFFLVELVGHLQKSNSGIDEIVLFVDQLERTFESGDNPELYRLENISKKFINLLDTVGVGKGIRIFIASRKQYLPDFLSSFQNAFKYNLHFNVLQKISDENEQIGFVERVLRWCKKKNLVDRSVRLDKQASKELANAVDGHPLNMMLALIQIFSEGRTGRISKDLVERLKPWEQLFQLDEQLVGKDEIDWYFLLAMAHARTEIVRFEEVWWRLRLVSPSLTQRVDSLGRQGVLERLWLLGHLGRTIHARPLDDDPARFMEFFHANLRDYLIRDVMNYGGGELRSKGGKRGTPPVWRALDRLLAVAKEWKQSQQLLLREDVRFLMEQKDVFVEPIKKEGGAQEVEAFYLLFLRDTNQSRDELFQNAKECVVYSAVVHDDLGRWAFKQLFPNISDQVKCCTRWLQRGDKDSRIKILQYLIELRDVEANQLLSRLVFDEVQNDLNDVWPQIADILSEPLFASRYRSQVMIYLIEHLLRNRIAFPAQNWHTTRFGAFCTASCRGQRDELLRLIDHIVEGVAALQNHSLQQALESLLQEEERIESWLSDPQTGALDFSFTSREIHNYSPPKVELRAGEALQDTITEAQVAQWRSQISNQLGLPLPAFRLTFGETSDHEQDDEQAYIVGHELELRLDGRRVAIGDFYPERYQTLRRHWDFEALNQPIEHHKSHNEAMQESVVWLKKQQLEQVGWQKQQLSFEEAIENWLGLLLRRHIDRVFTLDDVLPFLNTLSSRLNIHELLRSISGNYPALWRVLVNLCKEFVPLNHRRIDLMIELQELVRQIEQINTANITQKLREHVGVELCKTFADETNQLSFLLLDSELEKKLIEKLRIAQARHSLDLNPDEGLKLVSAIRGQFEKVVRHEDITPVLVCQDNLRLSLFRLIQHFDSRIHVLSYTELSPEVHPTSKGIVSGVSLTVND